MPITPVGYSPRPYVRGGNLGELLRLRGRNAADAELRNAEIQSRMWSDLGQTISGGIQGYAQQRQAQQDTRKVEQKAADEKDHLSRQDTAFLGLLEKQANPDPREVMAIYGPQKGMQIAQGLSAFGELQTGAVKDARDTAGRLAVGAKALAPQLRQSMWPAIRGAAIKGGLGSEQDIPEQPTDEYLDAVIGWATGKEQAQAESGFTLSPGQKRFGPDGKPIASVEAAPEKPAAPTSTSLALEAAGGDPLKALQLLRAQNASQAQPDTEWVTRNGEAVQIRKGTAQRGDVPYSAPKSTSETAQDRQRKGRLDSARGFLTRLNELRESINTKIGPQAGLTGLARQGAAAIGLDPDVAEYERVRAAGGRALAVAIMGAQNLSDADASAWSNMLPGARIDKETAKRLTDQIGKMLEDTDTAGPATPGPIKVHAQPFVVTAPDGSKHEFSSQAEADRFKQLAGI